MIVRVTQTVLCSSSRPSSLDGVRVGPRGGGGVGTRPWWLALLACGGAYWPLTFEPSAMTSSIRTTAGIRTAAGIHLPGGESRMQLLPMASSPDGLISARYTGGGGIKREAGGGGGIAVPLAPKKLQ